MQTERDSSGDHVPARDFKEDPLFMHPGERGIFLFEHQSVENTARKLHTNMQTGLSWEEAVSRLSADGKNELEKEHRQSKAEAFLEQLNDPLICVLLAAAFVSVLLREFSDALIIAVVVLMNAAVGVIQEGKAQKALDALKQLTSPTAMVKRNGEIQEIPAAELVTGDVVILEVGRQVPADLRLSVSWNLHTEESALTGESLPVEKDASFCAEGELPVGERKNEVFMSTLVTAGRGEGIVTATGMHTEIGKIAAIIKQTPRELTPLQKKLAELGKVLSIVSIIICVLLFMIAAVQGRNIPEMLITAISLAVAAVPEGLPAVVTIVLAMSVSRMVKVNTIVRKLPSVETLGAVNVVCSDKTGTLTQNKMTVTSCYLNERMLPISVHTVREQAEIPLEFLRGFALCNDAVISQGKSNKKKEFGDPTELALLRMAAQCGIRAEREEEHFPRIRERSFDAARKMMTTVHADRDGYVAFTKGAPDVVLKRCTKILLNGSVRPLNDAKRKRIEAAVQEMSTQALRVLALAMKRGTDPSDNSGGGMAAGIGNGGRMERGKRRISGGGEPDGTEEQDLIFLGLAGMKDPIRPEAKEAVKKFKDASVCTVMITGDHADTALAIARELDIAKSEQECMSAAELERLSDETLKQRLAHTRVFARVSPEHKVRIVKLLKESGNIVAMTGDGVNDAPSLRMADIGIAMGKTGTDVARHAADMILTDDNFATIEKAIEEGRSIFQNIKKTVLFLLSSNFGEIITMFTAVILGLAAPLKASHILWINLITDSLPALALGVDENDKEELMKEPPRGAGDGMFADGGLACTIFYGLLIAAISLTAFLKLPWQMLLEARLEITLENLIQILQDENILKHAQTYSFTVLAMSQLFHALGMRDVRTSVFSGKRSFNPVMAAAFGVGFILQLAVTEIPALVQIFGTVSLTFGEWISLAVLSAFPILAHEVFILAGKRFPGRNERNLALPSRGK